MVKPSGPSLANIIILQTQVPKKNLDLFRSRELRQRSERLRLERLSCILTNHFEITMQRPKNKSYGFVPLGSLASLLFAWFCFLLCPSSFPPEHVDQSPFYHIIKWRKQFTQRKTSSDECTLCDNKQNSWISVFYFLQDLQQVVLRMWIEEFAYIMTKS